MPPSSTSTKPGRTCPNCRAFVPQGNPRCQSCKLEVKQMDAFAAAKKAALAKGKRGVSEEPRELPFYLKPGNIFKVVLVLLVVGGLAYYFRPRPPRYMAFPSAANDAISLFLKHIAAGDDKNLDQAYGLIADSARNPKANDEIGAYRQIFDEMNNYLTREFGAGWDGQAQLAADPADPSTIIVKVSVETLHIHVAQQVPADKKSVQGSHFAITGMDEFDVRDAADYGRGEAIGGVIGGIAGSDAQRLVMGVAAAVGNDMHKPLMVRKVNLLRTLHDPRQTIWRVVLKAYPQQLRNDPVIRRRLELIRDDGRYDDQAREKAKQVLEDKVPEEELIGAGVAQ